MAYLGVFKFDRVFARRALFRHPAAEARTAIGASFYLTNKKCIPRQHGGHCGGQGQKLLQMGIGVGQSLQHSLASFICHRRSLLTYMAA
jgi:hypothetical protein